MARFACSGRLHRLRAPGLTRSIRWLAVAPLLVACAPEAGPASSPSTGRAWEAAILKQDRDRLDRLEDAWSTSLVRARAGGHGAEVDALGPLADSEAALSDATPPAGPYRCRAIKLGGQGLAYVAYSWFECEVTRAGGSLRLDKLTGSQRQHGVLYPDSGGRMVFLGTLALGSDERVALAYGADPERNVVGVLERIGPERWRLVQPWPHFESNLDLLELVPAR